MARKLKPCGTYAAYARHLKHGERPCEPCTLANRERYNSAPTGFNAYERQMAAALEANPPVIVWELAPGGIRVPVYINDPHADTGVHPNARKTHCKRGHPFDEENTRVEADGSRECRTCKNEKRRVPRPECADENLLAAARTEL